MKRLFIMLLILCSAITTASADQSASPQKKPESVIATLKAIIYKFGQSEGQVYAVTRNPSTGIIESRIQIVPFRCSTNAMQNDNVMNAVALNFPKDEPLSYQFQHIQPGSKQYYLMDYYTYDEAENKTFHVRTHDDQEMWLMCCKNPENPQLRDVYAVTWVLSSDKKIANGIVYMITSLRPDIYEKAVKTDKKAFGSEERVNKDSHSNAVEVAKGVQTGTSQNWKSDLSTEQQALLELKAELIEMDVEKTKASYESIGKELAGMRNGYKMRMNFEEILGLNKALDKKFQEVIKLATDYGVPTDKMPEIYKEIIEFYTEQNQAISDINRSYGAWTKESRKAQKYVNEQMEKYIKELEKAFE